MSKVLCIPDLHLPFGVPGLVSFIRKIIKKEKPDRVVFLGDVVDQYAFSRFNKDPDSLGPTVELVQAKSELTCIIKELDERPTDICIGNHEVRLYKQAVSIGIPHSFMRTLQDLLELPKDIKFVDKIQIDKVTYTHGDGCSGRNAEVKLIETYRTPVVIGHLHGQCGIKYLDNGNGISWAMTGGCLVDKDSYAMTYGKHNRDKPVLAIEIIEDGVPRIIPFSL